jgi:hypothetical protein
MATAGSVRPADIVTESGTTYWVKNITPRDGGNLVVCEKQDGTVGQVRFAESAVTILGPKAVVDSVGVKATHYNR